jgi:hypothetical protein
VFAQWLESWLQSSELLCSRLHSKEAFRPHPCTPSRSGQLCGVLRGHHNLNLRRIYSKQIDQLAACKSSQYSTACSFRAVRTLSLTPRTAFPSLHLCIVEATYRIYKNHQTCLEPLPGMLFIHGKADSLKRRQQVSSPTRSGCIWCTCICRGHAALYTSNTQSVVKRVTTTIPNSLFGIEFLVNCRLMLTDSKTNCFKTQCVNLQGLPYSCQRRALKTILSSR